MNWPLAAEKAEIFDSLINLIGRRFKRRKCMSGTISFSPMVTVIWLVNKLNKLKLCIFILCITLSIKPLAMISSASMNIKYLPFACFANWEHAKFLPNHPSGKLSPLMTLNLSSDFAKSAQTL